MATAVQKAWPGVLGFTPGSSLPSVTSTLAMSTTATQLAFSFVLSDSKTPTAARAFVSAITGSPLAANTTAEIQTDSSGQPSGSNVTGYTAIAASANPAAGAWLVWNSGWTGAALAANTMYWLVLKQSDGTNFPTFRWLQGILSPYMGGNLRQFGWAKAQNTAGTWGTFAAAASALRLDFSDATYAGCPISNAASSGDTVFGVRESGVLLTTPPGGILQVKGLAFGVQSPAGSPAGLRMGLRVAGGAAVYTQNTIAPGNLTNAQWLSQYFSAPQTISPGSSIRVTIADASGNADISSVNFKLIEYTLDSDANSLALLPVEGTPVICYSTDGSSFTDNARSSIYPFALLLDTNGEFGSSGGTGGVSRARLNAGA